MTNMLAHPNLCPRMGKNTSKLQCVGNTSFQLSRYMGGWQSLGTDTTFELRILKAKHFVETKMDLMVEMESQDKRVWILLQLQHQWKSIKESVNSRQTETVCPCPHRIQKESFVLLRTKQSREVLSERAGMDLLPRGRDKCSRVKRNDETWLSAWLGYQSFMKWVKHPHCVSVRTSPETAKSSGTYYNEGMGFNGEERHCSVSLGTITCPSVLRTFS